MTKEELEQTHKDTFEICLSIMQKKNADYGSEDNPFKNFEGSKQFGIDPIKGILLRIGDKLQRVDSFLDKGHLAVEDENVTDSIEDAINYLILSKAMLKERSKENENR